MFCNKLDLRERNQISLGCTNPLLGCCALAAKGWKLFFLPVGFMDVIIGITEILLDSEIEL